MAQFKLLIEIKVEVEDLYLENYEILKPYLRQLNLMSYVLVIFITIDPVDFFAHKKGELPEIKHRCQLNLLIGNPISEIRTLERKLQEVPAQDFQEKLSPHRARSVFLRGASLCLKAVLLTHTDRKG